MNSINTNVLNATGRPSGASDESVSPYKIYLPIALVEVLICLFGLVGNTLTCIAVKRNRKLHIASNFYVVSLAVSDLLVAAILVPARAAQHLSLYCRVFLVSKDFVYVAACVGRATILASLGNLTALSIDRFVALRYPIRYRTRIRYSRSKVMFAILVVWASSIFLTIIHEISGKNLSMVFAVVVFLSAVVIGIANFRIFLLVREQVNYRQRIRVGFTTAKHRTEKRNSRSSSTTVLPNERDGSQAIENSAKESSEKVVKNIGEKFSLGNPKRQQRQVDEGYLWRDDEDKQAEINIGGKRSKILEVEQEILTGKIKAQDSMDQADEDNKIQEISIERLNWEYSVREETGRLCGTIPVEEKGFSKKTHRQMEPIEKSVLNLNSSKENPVVLVSYRKHYNNEHELKFHKITENVIRAPVIPRRQSTNHSSVGRKSNKQVDHHKPDDISPRRSRVELRDDLKTAKTVTIVVAVFIILLFPRMALILYHKFFQETGNSQLARLWLRVLVYVNSIVNPLLYAWRMEEFRKEFKKISVNVFHYFCCITKACSSIGPMDTTPNQSQVP